MTARAELIALLRRRVALLPVAERERYLLEIGRCVQCRERYLTELDRVRQSLALL